MSADCFYHANPANHHACFLTIADNARRIDLNVLLPCAHAQTRNRDLESRLGFHLDKILAAHDRNSRHLAVMLLDRGHLNLVFHLFAQPYLAKMADDGFSRSRLFDNHCRATILQMYCYSSVRPDHYDANR